MLRRAPGIEDRHLMHARDRAVRSAGFLCHILAADVVHAVLLQRNSGIAALLRAVVHQTVLADVQVTSPRTAAPLVRPSLRDVILETINAGETALLHRLHFVINALF